MTQYVDPVHLRQLLTQYYNTGELRTLCFDLGIDYESLGGRGKAEKVAELILYAQRNNRLDDIVNYVRKTRPFVQLKMRDTPPPPLDEAESQRGAVTINVKGDLIQGDKMSGDKVGGDKITVGNISGSSGIAIGRGASANVTITQATPQDKADFTAQIEELKAMLEKAIADNEFNNADDAQDAADDLNKALREANKDAPRVEQLKSRLESVSGLIEAGAKAGTAVIKATPIIATLIKAISVIF